MTRIEAGASGLDALRARLQEIERALDAGIYQPGPWRGVLRAARALPGADRASIMDDVSRISRKLHQRSNRRMLPLGAGLALEATAVAVGAVLLAIGLQRESNGAAIAGAIFWAVSFQPVIKMLVGRALGVRYEYLYFFALEPRFKMRYGTYLAAPRVARVALHLAGTIGSPFGLLASEFIIRDSLPVAATVCLVLFWEIVALNLGLLIVGLLGIRGKGVFRAEVTSGGMAGIELREAFGW